MGFGNNTRKPTVSGTFYPSDKEELISMLKNFFKNTKEVLPGEEIKALISPHAGYICSGQTAAWGYKQLKATKDKHFVLIGPSHAYPFNGLASSTSNFWKTPLGKVRQICSSCHSRESGNPYRYSRMDPRVKPEDDKIYQIFLDERPHITEHSLEVQIPFLQYLFDDFSISCFLTGYQVNYEKAADYFLKSYPNSIFIISSDLAHYLPQNITEQKDKKTIEAILKQNPNYFLSEENTACGQSSILVLMAMAKRENWKSKLIYYDTSATAMGDKSGVVGYAAIGFYR